jgi:hypothetical protein
MWLYGAHEMQNGTFKAVIAFECFNLFIYLKTDNAAAGNTEQKTATNVYPVKNKLLETSYYLVSKNAAPKYSFDTFLFVSPCKFLLVLSWKGTRLWSPNK